MSNASFHDALSIVRIAMYEAFYKSRDIRMKFVNLGILVLTLV